MHNTAKKISECIKAKINEIGIDCIDEKTLCELGQWTDIVKDMVEYDYYKRILDAMDEEEEMEELECKMYGGRMGYRGRDSRGRFVHMAGRGRSAGYTPFIPPFMMGEQYADEYPEMYDNYRMGYTGGRMDGMSGGAMRENADGSRYGRSYDNYKQAKRHYTETKSPEHQKQMRDSIAEVFDDMEEITVDMVRDMTPEEKQRYKQKLQQMMQKIQ